MLVDEQVTAVTFFKMQELIFYISHYKLSFMQVYL